MIIIIIISWNNILHLDFNAPTAPRLKGRKRKKKSYSRYFESDDSNESEFFNDYIITRNSNHNLNNNTNSNSSCNSNRSCSSRNSPNMASLSIVSCCESSKRYFFYFFFDFYLFLHIIFCFSILFFKILFLIFIIIFLIFKIYFLIFSMFFGALLVLVINFQNDNLLKLDVV